MTECSLSAAGWAYKGRYCFLGYTERYIVNNLFFIIGKVDVRYIDVVRLRHNPITGNIHWFKIQYFLTAIYAQINYSK